MQLNITARHLDLTPALTDYVRKKVERAQRYFDSIVWAQTILTVEKHRQIAEVVVHTPGNTFRTKGEAGDLYSAIDLATHKLDIHLTRVKDKRKSRRKNSPRYGRESYLPQLFELESQSFSRLLKEKKRISLVRNTLSQAVQILETGKNSFYMYIDDQTNQITVLYRKGQEGYGIVEAEV